MSATDLLGLAIIIAAVLLLIVFATLQRTRPPVFRNIASFANLRRSIGLAVEEGTRLHFSLGRGGITTAFSAAGFAGLSMLRRVAELTSVSDRPPVVTSGDGALAALSQDTLQSSYEAAVAVERFDPHTGRMTGLTPFSYAAGTLPVMRDENVSTNVMAGSFGIEVALMIDAAERGNAFSLVASDNLPAQAVLYASTPKSPHRRGTLRRGGLCAGWPVPRRQLERAGCPALGDHRSHHRGGFAQIGGRAVKVVAAIVAIGTGLIVLLG